MKNEFNQDICGHCKEPIQPGWENGWPLFGTIDLGFSAQAFGALCGMKTCASEAHFEIWSLGHPALEINEAQHLRFRWTEKTDYRLCYSCQKELINLVGKFFKYPQIP